MIEASKEQTDAPVRDLVAVACPRQDRLWLRALLVRMFDQLKEIAMTRSIRLLAGAAVIAAVLSGPAFSQAAPQTLSVMKVDPQVAGDRLPDIQGGGQHLVNESNETVGTIDDLIVTPNEKVPFAVLSVGGFLGMRTKYVVVPLDGRRHRGRANFRRPLVRGHEPQKAPLCRKIPSPRKVAVLTIKLSLPATRKPRTRACASGVSCTGSSRISVVEPGHPLPTNGYEAACTGLRTSESTGEYVDNSVISNKVRGQLMGDKNLNIFQVLVQFNFKRFAIFTSSIVCFINLSRCLTRSGTAADRRNSYHTKSPCDAVGASVLVCPIQRPGSRATIEGLGGGGHGAEPVRRLRRALGLRGFVILFSATRCCRRTSAVAVPIHQPAARLAQLSQMLRGVPLIACCLYQCSRGRQGRADIRSEG